MLAAEAALARSFSVIDRAFEGSPYLAGETFSLADISLMPYVASLPAIGAARLLDDLPRIGASWGRVRERPSWQKVIAVAES